MSKRFNKKKRKKEKGIWKEEYKVKQETFFNEKIKKTLLREEEMGIECKRKKEYPEKK